MLQLDRVASLVVLAFGGILMFGAMRMDLGSPNQPGPGFLPLWAAGLLVALSLCYAVSSFRRKVSVDEVPTAFPMSRARLIAVVVSLAAYCALLSHAGFVVATLALMTALFLIAEPGRWLSAFLKAALCAAVSWLLFEKLLMIQFPAGPFGG